MRLIENEEKWGKRKWNDRKETERNRKKKKEKSHRYNKNWKLEGKIDREKKRRNWLETENDK